MVSGFGSDCICIFKISTTACKPPAVSLFWKAKPFTVLINPVQFDVLLQEQDARRMYDSSYDTKDSKAGSKEITFHSQNGAIKIVSSIYVKAGSAYVLCLDEFVRVGSSDIHLTDRDLQRFYQERLRSPDAQPIKDTNLSDLDKRTISAYKNLRKLQKENAPEIDLRADELLKSYNLLSKDGKHFNSAKPIRFSNRRKFNSNWLIFFRNEDYPLAPGRFGDTFFQLRHIGYKLFGLPNNF